MTEPVLNQTLDLIEPSRSVTLLARLRQMQAEDPSILNLTGGEPDFPTPKPICDEVYRQLLSGCTHYGDPKGDPDLRREIALKLAAENHAPYRPDNILVTPGGKYAIYVAIQALLNPGDEVLWLTPGWVSYPAIASLCGGTPVAVHLDWRRDYRITRTQLEAHTTSRTRLLIINYPNNPTGKLLSKSDQEELTSFLRAHPDIYCLSDEIYEKLIYQDEPCVSLASDPELFERILVVNGFSKCSAMTGWRVGYLACNPQIYAAALKIFQHSMSCTSSFVQKGAITALHLPEEIERMRKAYEQRRDLIYEGLRPIPHVTFPLPEGSFYAWVQFDTELTSEALCGLLLDKAGIGGIPGSAYGEESDCFVRFCFAADEETLREFVSRLDLFCRTEL